METNTERKLATIQKIVDVKPIPEADMIEAAQVKNWKVVIKKGEFKPGALVIYCEIDSFLPVRPEFEFLRKSSYRKLENGDEGFRLRTIKLRGVISQGLLLPINLLGDKLDLEIGTDVSELLGIKKYEPPSPLEMADTMKGQFPYFIPKTGGDRVQNLYDDYNTFKDSLFYVTEKLDGSSATFYMKDGEFGVCTKNIDLLENQSNSFWYIARQFNIEGALKELGINIAIQGELIGSKIQKNIYNLKEVTLKVFAVYFIDECRYANFQEILKYQEYFKKFQLEWVPILDKELQLPETIDQLLEIAEGKSQLNSKVEREGLFVYSHDTQIKFKVISNKYLLKSKD